MEIFSYFLQPEVFFLNEIVQFFNYAIVMNYWEAPVV